MKIKNICVIGAGVSGLVTAKTFLEEGYDVTVFEKKPGLGGVWEKSRSYPELTTQNTSDTYCFSDYPMPVSYPEWPTAEQVRNYLESYAQHFEVINKIKFATEVINVSRKTGVDPSWVVTVKTNNTHQEPTKEESYEFDFVVICNGAFSLPNVPVLPGQEEFMASGGKILHSTEFNDASILEGKQVVVVGGSKSASDVATVAATNAQKCTLVLRKVMWRVPRFFLGTINLKKVLLTRFSEAWMPYEKMGKLERILHTFGSPIVWLFWRTVELVLRLQFGLDRCGMLPDHHINALDCAISVAPPDFFKYIHEQKIQIAKTSVSRFVPGGVELANGQKLEADIVIFGTGFIQDIPFLENKYRQQIVDEERIIHLYRHLIHPEVPQMGFVGFNTSFYSPLTSEVGAWWLVDYVQGYFSLPSPSEMLQRMESELNWLKNQYQYIVSGGVCLASFSLRYVEQLIEDMDANHQVVIWQGIPQIMNTVDISLFGKVRQELKSQRTKNVGISEKLAVK
ncbi:MAG TPA: FAD-dependent oxidoreductase [Nostocaceae cyanobacterium]|nr:FAD-dependent oxidoreductase [Nostocaceae cyanobacterium]